MRWKKGMGLDGPRELLQVTYQAHAHGERGGHVGVVEELGGQRGGQGGLEDGGSVLGGGRHACGLGEARGGKTTRGLGGGFGWEGKG